MPGYQAEKNQNAKQLLQSLQTSLRDFASRHRNRILDGEKKAASRLPYLPAYGIALMILWYSVSWPPPRNPWYPALWVLGVASCPKNSDWMTKISSNHSWSKEFELVRWHISEGRVRLSRDRHTDHLTWLLYLQELSFFEILSYFTIFYLQFLIPFH